MTTKGSAATTSAADLDEHRWADRRLVSWTLRVVVVAIPVIAALIATRLYLAVVDRPTAWLPQVVFWAGALFVSIAVSMFVDRWSRRLLPLAVLFRMSLVFPDEAPSRFRVALREGNSKKLEAKIASGEMSAEGSAAQNLIALVGVLSRHDRMTRGHSERVRAYSELIGVEMGLEPADLEKLRWGALIHDIGKLTVPPEVLNKDGKPSDEEWQIIRGHPGASAAYLGVITPWLGEWVLAAEQHHERWDGNGYPHGLAAEEISLAGRIVAVADAYDVMTSARSYKKALSPSLAREELARNAGTQFDPVVVRAMLKVSLGKLRVVLGPLGWLNELAWVTQVPQAATTAAVTASTAAAVSVGAVLSTEAPIETAEPAAVERVVVETTTTMAPPTTTSVQAVLETTSTTVDTTTSTTTSTSTTTTSTSSTTTTTVAAAPTTTVAIETGFATPTTTLVSTTTMVPTTTTTTAAPTTTTTTTVPPTTTSTTTTVPPTTTTVPVVNGPTGSGFVEVDPATLPSTLGNGQLTSSDHMFIWAEGVKIVAGPVTLRTFTDGEAFEGSTDATVTIASGTSVCTYFLHYDPDWIVGDRFVELDFGVAPLGFALRADDLEATNGYGVPGLDHQSDGLGSEDAGKVLGTTMSFRFEYSFFGRDQVRIFLPC